MECELCGKNDKFKNLKCCKNCYDKRHNDIIEIIYRREDEKIVSHIFSNDDVKYGSMLLNELEGANIVLDLHGVLDTIDPSVKLPFDKKYSVVVCSFVGKFTKIRMNARKEISSRIKSNQVSWGVLIFKHGNQNNREQSNNFQEIGSKAWFVNLVGPALFFDDSHDHVNSVSSLGKRLKSIKINKNDDVISIFAKHNIV
jgi:hypothetical protein